MTGSPDRVSAAVAAAPGSTRPALVPTRFARAGLVAVADQGAAAAAGLAINLLLARWLAPDGYGAFALGFAIVIVLAGAHDALLVEPMTVLGPSRHGGRLQSYLRAGGEAHARVVAVVAVVLVLTGGAFGAAGKAHVGAAVAGAGLAAPGVLWLLLARRMSYVVGAPLVALRASLASGGAALLALIALRSGRLLTPFAALCCLGAAGAAAGAVTSRHLSGRRAEPSWRSVLAEHWRYARLPLLAAAVTVVASHGQVFVVAAAGGLADAAALRAMLIPTMPAAHVLTALGAFALPHLAATFADRGTVPVRVAAGRLSSRLLAGALGFEALLLVAHRPVERLLFGGTYAEDSWLIPVLGLAPVLAAATLGPSLTLRASQRPGHYLVSAMVTGPVGLAAGTGLAWRWGVAGAAWAIVATYASSLAVNLVMASRLGRR